MGETVVSVPDKISEQRDDFVFWNTRLLESFFSPASSGEEVWLQVSPDELDSIGRDLGGDEGFVRAVKAGPPWKTVVRGGYVYGEPRDMVARVQGLIAQRKEYRRRPEDYCDPGDLSEVYRNQRAPSYLPFLAALVRSAADAGEEGFYAHLRNALELSPTWNTQDLKLLEAAWKDLERWTRASSGQFGVFRFRALGGYSRIGVPRSQCIASRQDRMMLPALFTEIGLRPGQDLSSSLLSDVKNGIIDSNHFSSHFRQATSNENYGEIISQQLEGMLEDWDGTTPPSTKYQGKTAPAVLPQEGLTEAVELCLSLDGGTNWSWQIHWRVPSLFESDAIMIRNEGSKWEIPMVGSEPAASIGDEGEAVQAAARRILGSSDTTDVAFQIALGTEDGWEESVGEICLRKAILRILVWHYEPTHGRYELREGPLPRHSAAYLLAPPGNEKRLRDYLSREGIEYQDFDTAGLPDGWMLECLPDCSRLTEEQRNAIPDGKRTRSAPRIVRLAGGRSVSRGHVRQYMSYDLPFVELDAPEGAELRADGLSFYEEHGSRGIGPAIRRFRITQNTRGPRRYDIEAFHNGRRIGGARLRVSPDTGEATVLGGDEFSLDPKGWPQGQLNGLRGLLRGEVPDVGGDVSRRFDSEPDSFGQEVTAAWVEAKTICNPAAMFLDTLAQKGSIAYGPARDQLARLLAKSGDSHGVGITLLQLRSRGHLEIQVDTEGHMARIHTVEPTLHELSATAHGNPVYGLLGSLRLQQWKSLVENAEKGLVRAVQGEESILEDWRIVPSGSMRVADLASRTGLAIGGRPALGIARWAAHIGEVGQSIERICQESPPGGGVESEKFVAASGLFRGQQDQVRIDDGIRCQLFRMPDSNSDRLRVHALGINGDGGERYGYVKDVSWGKWIALGAFSSYVKDAYGIDDASPWPIPYSSSNGTVWLPARIKLPHVLERCLMLCSGSGPAACKVKGEVNGDVIELIEQRDGRSLGLVSRVYDHMAGGSTWLGYKWVPREVADEVAKKIGGILAPMDSLQIEANA